jgi:hypothetical protein
MAHTTHATRTIESRLNTVVAISARVRDSSTSRACSATCIAPMRLFATCAAHTDVPCEQLQRGHRFVEAVVLIVHVSTSR